uniref:Predicted protein n=1 Tax=Hordeum vulgare subsp. vulgare TaxID=112509 RepID=F2EL55_HORVV|nr:predicted protein [Hordeum vulgare subsp. vulgare]
MDKQSVAACFVVILLLLGSSMSAEICERTNYLLVRCSESKCKWFCQLDAKGTKRRLDKYWCSGAIFAYCNCKLCGTL